MTTTQFTNIIGKTLVSVEAQKGGDTARFVASDGSEFCMWHDQDCCESVRIEDIIGDLADLIGSPILKAEETTECACSGGYESATWTFYHFATVKGYVTFRWLGESNGYYSEAVTFEQTK